MEPKFLQVLLHCQAVVCPCRYCYLGIAWACNVTLFQQLIPAAAVEYPARVQCPFPKLSVNSSAIKTTLNYKSLRGRKEKKRKSKKYLLKTPMKPSLGHRGDWVERGAHLC